MYSYSFALLWTTAIAYGALKACDYCRMPRLHFLPITPTKLKWLKAEKPENYFTGSIYYESGGNLVFRNCYTGYPIPFSDKPLGPTAQFNSHGIDQAQNVFKSEIPTIYPKLKRSLHRLATEAMNTGYVPLYINPIRMGTSMISQNNNEASRLIDDYLNKMKKLNENNIKHCSDLRAIHYIRNHGMIIQDDVISARNKIYNYISKDDLEEEINNKCNQLASAITMSKSTHDANSKRPHSLLSDILSRRHYDKGGDYRHKSVFPTQLNIFVISPSNPILESNTELDPIHQSSSYHLTTQANQISEEIVTEILNGNSEMPCCRSDALATSIPTETTKLTSTDSTTSKPNQKPSITDIENKTKLRKVMVPPPKISEFDEMNPNIEIQSMTTVMEPIDTDQFESYGQFQDIVDTVDKQQSFELTNPKSNTSLDRDGASSVGKASNRQEYLEGEYEITKVVTIEFSNNTITSDVQGNEKIPNLDFGP